MENDNVSKDIEKLKQIENMILELEDAKELLEENICTWTEQEEEFLTDCGFEKIHNSKFMLREGHGPRAVDLQVFKTWSREEKRVCFRAYLDPGCQSSTSYHLSDLLESLEEMVSEQLEQTRKDSIETSQRVTNLEALLQALRQEEGERE